MNYLVDTHIFLWVLFFPAKISKPIKKILADPETVKYISVITFWEISLKFSLRKIDLTGILPDNLPKLAQDSGFKIWELNSETASTFHKLPVAKNRDPFDRMLAWQTICGNYTLLTQDKSFMEYENQNLHIAR